MTALKPKPILAVIAAALLAASVAAPADAQRGGGNGRGGGDRGGDHGNRGDQGGNRGGGGDRSNNRGGGGNNNWNNNNRGGGGDWNRNDNRRGDWDRSRDYDRDNWSFSFNLGSPFYRSYDYGRPYYRYSPGVTVYSYNAWGLRPYECRVDYEFDYWFGRPADIEVRRCADAYGNIYIVDGGRRLWRYR